jgi:hypothetical protein
VDAVRAAAVAAAVILEPPHPGAFSDDDLAHALAARSENGSGSPTREMYYDASLDGPAAEAVYRRLCTVAASIAAVHFGLERVGNYACGKLLEYRAGSAGVEWHADDDVPDDWTQKALVRWGQVEAWQWAEMKGRVISVMVQLSDGDDYEGGALELDIDGDVVQVPRTRGTVTITRSTCRHRVLPITAGTRRSLVVFFGWSPRGRRRT